MSRAHEEEQRSVTKLYRKEQRLVVVVVVVGRAQDTNRSIRRLAIHRRTTRGWTGHQEERKKPKRVARSCRAAALHGQKPIPRASLPRNDGRLRVALPLQPGPKPPIMKLERAP